jgi:hypothetical protein
MRIGIEGVDVIVNRRDVRTQTRAGGHFVLEILPTDSTVGFRRIGFRPLLLALIPLPPVRDTVLVAMEPSAVELPDIIVKGIPSKPLRYAGTTKYDDVFRRRRVGLGTLVTRDAIERGFGRTTAEFLQLIPGVHYSNGPPKRLRFARCQNPQGITVFIDGTRQIASGMSGSGGGVGAGSSSRPGFEESPEVELVSRVIPSDIEMIEVYRGVSEIPGEFHWDGCAVIAIWTRWNK